MLEYLILTLFILSLFIAIIFSKPILLALLINLFLLIFYAKKQGHQRKEIFNMIISGVRESKTILIVFSLIGVITGIWRLSGTISYLIYHGTRFINPAYFYVSIFVFNSVVSFLTGTGFGTSSTSGVICMAISNAMNFNPIISGGAIISGAFFGDRSSPMSTSALLVATLTKTDLYDNLKKMFKTCVIPFILTVLTFQLFNLNSTSKLDTSSINSIAEIFNFSIFLLIPTISIIILAIFKVKLIINMSVSIVFAIILSVFIQNSSLKEIVHTIIFGFNTPLKAGNLINGGGFISMLNVNLIVAISSCYLGFFKNTKLLISIKSFVDFAFIKCPKTLVMAIISTVISIFSSNQTLSIMLTYEMSRTNYKNNSHLALDLENTAVLTSTYIPWNLAGKTPLVMIGAPTASLLFCFYHHYVVVVNSLFSAVNFYKNKFKQK